MGQTQLKILIADDHRLFREGLRQICEVLGDFKVVGEAENGQAAVDLARRLNPDVILMDVQMPVLDGVQATSLIMEDNPAARVIILTMYRQDHYVFEALKAGARGYLLKDTDGQTLVEAVRAAQRGEALIDPAMAARVVEEFRRLSQAAQELDAESLTEGEMAVLRLVARGEENRTIAEQLFISESTVANRLREVYRKLHVNNRTQAALAALRRGWVQLDPE
jgi:DNA-binding NarL/FixJ family response regulator